MMFPFFVVFIFVLSSEAVSPPQFSDAHTVKGTLYIPYAELREPFFAWYDLKNGVSRIDYYGGMVKTYQLSQEGSFGTSIKIAPITTETVKNVDTCLQVNGSSELGIKTQKVLPDLTGFELIGNEIVNDIECEKWRLVDTVGNKVNKYTVWIRYKGGETASKTAIPVRYEMKGYNTLLGSHYDHYYIEYDWYSYEVPDPDVFRLAPNITCQSFPGPGIDHVYTFNPIHEFVRNNDEHVHNTFNMFKNKFGKIYKDMLEHFIRLENYRQNARFIHSRNRAGLSYKLELNHLADRSNAEMKALRGRRYSGVKYNGGNYFPYSKNQVKTILKNVPENLDWRLYGAVTPVKDQSVCGSCWSFGTTGTIEGAYFLKHNKLVRLSQQALIDCSWGFGNNGCDGGEDFRAYQWMMKHGGLPTEDDYGGYLGQDGYCHLENITMTAKITGFFNVTSGDKDALKVAVAKHGPISVAIDAAHKSFSFYSNGVFYEPTCGNTEEQLDHAVLVVGYGTMNGEEYWLVKNSWSNYWGNDGYVLMSAKDNNCGVTTDATYVVM